MMIALPVIVLDELRNGLSEVALAERHHPIEALALIEVLPT